MLKQPQNLFLQATVSGAKGPSEAGGRGTPFEEEMAPARELP